jgi:3-phenylpropionate/trans-cinnamate dioxygenase ferredoxin reductase subunit
MGAGTVIIGTGQAGFEVGASLRAEGYQEPVTLIGEERHLPYQRPPLSKSFVLTRQGMDELELRPAAFYRDHGLELIVGERVVAIDRSARQVRTASGGVVAYESLVLAVGSRNRLLQVDGARLDGVLNLRTLDEAITIKERIEATENIVVLGGGFIGLELAAVARSLGKSVTVLEAQPRLMPRVVAPVISEFYRGLHGGHGVEIVCSASVTKIEGAGGKVQAVQLSDGASYSASLVLVGIGVVPNVELARAAGLAVGNGVVVNECLQTTDPDIYAVGDCAEHPNPFAGERVRLESIQNACDQGRSVAAAIVGRRHRYEALPWFWTDQFDVRLQMAGLSQGHDRVVTRGDPRIRKFSVFYFKNSRLVAVDSINRPVDHIIARKLLSARVPVTPEQAGDEGVDLKTLGR